MRTALTEQYSAVAEALGVLGEQLGRPGDPEPYSSGRVADFFAQLGTPPQECAVTLDDLGRTHAAVTLPRTRFPRRSWPHWPGRWAASAAARWKCRRCSPARE